MNAEFPAGELYIEDVLAVSQNNQALHQGVLEGSGRLRSQALGLLSLSAHQVDKQNWALFRYTPDLVHMERKIGVFIYLYRNLSEQDLNLRIITTENYDLGDGKHLLVDDYMVGHADDIRHATGEVFFPVGTDSLDADRLPAPFVQDHDDGSLMINSYSVYPMNQKLIVDTEHEMPRFAQADADMLGTEQASRVLKQGSAVLQAVVDNDAYRVGHSNCAPQVVFRKFD